MKRGLIIAFVFAVLLCSSFVYAVEEGQTASKTVENLILTFPKDVANKISDCITNTKEDEKFICFSTIARSELNGEVCSGLEFFGHNKDSCVTDVKGLTFLVKRCDDDFVSKKYFDEAITCYTDLALQQVNLKYTCEKLPKANWFQRLFGKRDYRGMCLKNNKFYQLDQQSKRKNK